MGAVYQAEDARLRQGRPLAPRWRAPSSLGPIAIAGLMLIALGFAPSVGQTQEAGVDDEDMVGLLRVSPDGASQRLSSTRRLYRHPRVSADGTAVIFSEGTGSNGDIWSLDVKRDVPTRLTFSESRNFAPLWSPDGSSFVFTSSRSGHANIWLKATEGTSEPEHLMPNDSFQVVHDWSTDGRYLVFLEFGSGAQGGLKVLDLESREVESYLVTEFRESNATFSPDGRWVAYDSNESGQSEVYVRGFPLQGGKWRVSHRGGMRPDWAPDGGMVYYLGADNKFYGVAVEASGADLGVSPPVALFDDPYARFTTGRHWDVAPDGSFVFIGSVTQ
jgi:Tol biopolymer transport system component